MLFRQSATNFNLGNNQLCNFTTTNKTPTASKAMPEAGNFHAMTHASKTGLARDPVLSADVSLWIRPLCGVDRQTCDFGTGSMSQKC